MRENLKFTGERMLNNPESDIYKSHLSRYKFVTKFVKGKVVLDIACGYGYGTMYLSKYAKHVVGVDVVEEPVSFCKNRYDKKNLQFVLEDKVKENRGFLSHFDVIACLETIEHVSNYNLFLKKISKYLKPSGIIVMSSPNNFFHRITPENKFHVYEFDILELLGILKRSFSKSKIDVYGQGKTMVRRSQSIRQQKNTPRFVLSSLLKHVYDFDLKYVNFLRKIEHKKIYKVIGSLQRNYPSSFSIYKLDPMTDFVNPEISVFVVKRGRIKW